MIYLGLGSNIGNRDSNLQDAIKLLQLMGVNLVHHSSFYETKAWGKTDQADFMNAVIAVEFDGTPQELLEIVLKTEQILGRVRKEKWGPRLIDIDIILFHDLEVNDKNLVIPHPLYLERDFVMVPLLEVLEMEN